MRSLYAFILFMWALIIAGGGILTGVLGPISITGYGEADWIISSALKAAAAAALVAVWILVMSKAKRWIFDRTISGSNPE